MSVPDGTHPIGPDTGQLLVRTGRQGVAAKVGHDLTITFERWSGEVSVAGDDVSVQATIDTGSIKILEGTGGALPLTDRDRREITKTALGLLETNSHPQASFRSTKVARDGDSGSIEGELTIRGAKAPVSIAVTSRASAWHGQTTIRQTDFGIKPYKAFLGALKLADDVRIEIDLHAAWAVEAQ